RMEQELKPDIFLLDDGFQHRRLRRKHDVLLIDALDPTGGGVFPLGRLREPFSSVSRANSIVITRAARGESSAGIERMVARHTRAPVFRSRVVPLRWIDLQHCEGSLP